jgi:ssDNA-binding Zn-finger/Zn-ribbon topoisomerase 1
MSESAAERLHALPCPECGASLRLRKSKFGQFYGCERWPLCTGTHGAHPDGRPLGVPANTEAKAARHEAHLALEKIEAIMGRTAAYKWLATVLHIERVDCHIGLFGIEQCQRVVGAVTTFTRGRHK